MSVPPSWRQRPLCASRLAWSGLVGVLALTSAFSPRACCAHEARTEPEVKAQLKPRLLPMDLRLGRSPRSPSTGPGWYSWVLKGTPRTDASDRAERRSRSFRRRAACARTDREIRGKRSQGWHTYSARRYDKRNVRGSLFTINRKSSCHAVHRRILRLC